MWYTKHARYTKIYKQICALFVVLFAFGKCAEETPSIINVNLENWSNKSFRNPPPLIIANGSNFMKSYKKSEFGKYYSPLRTQLRAENGFYLFLENLNDTTLHLYGTKHPNTPNYRIDFSNSLIKKCSNETACEPLTKCHNDIVPSYTRFKDFVLIEKCSNETACEPLKKCDNGNVPSYTEFKDFILIEKCSNETVCKPLNKCDNGNVTSYTEFVYIAWKIKPEEVQILVQYKNQLVQCTDNETVLKIEKLVMHSKNDENIFIKTGSYLYSTTAQDKTLLSENFDSSNKSLFLHIAQCTTCQAVLELECGDYKNNISVSFNETKKNILLPSTIGYLWKEVSLKGPKSEAGCKLFIITTKTDNDEPFWALSRSIYTLDDEDIRDNNLASIPIAGNILLLFSVLICSVQ
ncbi:hypothetical protein Zmor_011264 [Zophobas morio]|uniref:Uncharacterized protein n=1 Tax=Zophobas morio TaxID=2755281 RepID=A0AA38IQN8_9CUCU|nr:hypothetical protein Zmor_011264 [Zophobas morio]